MKAALVNTSSFEHLIPDLKYKFAELGFRVAEGQDALSTHDTQVCVVGIENNPDLTLIHKWATEATVISIGNPEMATKCLFAGSSLHLNCESKDSWMQIWSTLTKVTSQKHNDGWQNLEIKKNAIKYKGEHIPLTWQRTAVTKLLAKARGSLVTDERLSQEIGNSEASGGALRTLICRLRKELPQEIMIGRVDSSGYFMQIVG